MADVPNVNLFIGYVNSLKGLSSSDDYVKDHFDERDFYSCGKNYDYVKYVNTGSKEQIDYIKYSGNKEKSTGIYNENGHMSPEQIANLRSKLRETGSCIWHGVISFEENFGKTYCNSYEQALKIMQVEMPKFFQRAKLDPKNIVWYAGLHTNTEHRHIHFSFFEKSPTRERFGRDDGPFFSDGMINIDAINKMKVSIELRALDIYDDIKDKRKEVIEGTKITIKDSGAIMKKINSLVFVLPMSGRLGYDSDNMEECRPLVDNVVNAIIKSNKDLKKKFDDFLSVLTNRDKELLKAYSKIKVDCTDKLLYDKCLNDIYRRLGNIVIKTARDIRKNQSKVEYETKSRLALKRIAKNKRRILFEKSMQLNDLVNREIISAFAEYREKLQEANFKRLVEEGYIETDY